MGDAAEVGSQLEQTVADFFVDSGYGARCNEVLEGRSGGRHEIDVLAEKSDDLTTFRVAVECKAWQQPVEKDVVSKLDYIVRDLGLNKGIVVGLTGFRSGAEQAATELGIELWGPDELRRHLGDDAVGELQVPPSAVNTTHALGHPVRCEPGSCPAEDPLRAYGLAPGPGSTGEQTAFSGGVHAGNSGGDPSTRGLGPQRRNAGGLMDGAPGDGLPESLTP